MRMQTWKLGMTTFAIATTAALMGCAGKEEAIVNLNYTLQPTKGLPPGLTSVAVMPAELGAATDAKWSDMTADMLTNILQQSRSRYGSNLRVADRMESKKVFDEADLSASGITSGAGGKPAELLGVQGFIVSKINIKEDVARGSKTSIDPLSVVGYRGRGFSTSEKEKVKKMVTAQAMFKLVDANNGEVWLSHEDKVTSTEESSTAPFADGGEAGLTMTDQIAGSLIERVAREFMSKLVPCEAQYEVAVASSNNPACAEGVSLLRIDDYSGAIEKFKTAVAENPEDDRAWFAMGVAYDAMGNRDQAYENYLKANKIKGDPQYAAAKKRIEGAR